jgi:hypothetical protein
VSETTETPGIRTWVFTPPRVSYIGLFWVELAFAVAVVSVVRAFAIAPKDVKQFAVGFYWSEATTPWHWPVSPFGMMFGSKTSTAMTSQGRLEPPV